MINKFLTAVSVLVLSSFLLIGCSSEEAITKDGLQITTSFSVLGNIISEVIGDRGTVSYIVPVGEEPHDYEPTPGDFAKISDSDAFYVNGMNLEEWLEVVVGNVTNTEVVTLSDGVEGIPLVDEDENDPHAWLSPKNIKLYVENIVTDLSKRDPEGKATFRANADAFLVELNELDQWITDQVKQVPENNRIIIVSENAFKYFGKDYGFETEGIWDINSLDEGTPQQYARLVNIVKERSVPALFVESTIDKRYMNTISKETGVAIGGEVYTDALGEKGSGADTYIGMIRENVKVFVEGLK